MCFITRKCTAADIVNATLSCAGEQLAADQQRQHGANLPARAALHHPLLGRALPRERPPHRAPLRSHLPWSAAQTLRRRRSVRCVGELCAQCRPEHTQTSSVHCLIFMANDTPLLAALKGGFPDEWTKHLLQRRHRQPQYLCGSVQGTVDILGQMLAGSLLFFIFRQQTSAFYFTQARPLRHPACGPADLCLRTCHSGAIVLMRPIRSVPESPH